MWVVMPLDLRMLHQHINKQLTRRFRKYLDFSMNFFLDDFIIFNDMESHLLKLWKCFETRKEFGIHINLKKCIFLVFSGMILGFIISKEDKLLDPKRSKQLLTCCLLPTFMTFKYVMGSPNSTIVL
jgi:hypothetical protein